MKQNNLTRSVVFHAAFNRLASAALLLIICTPGLPARRERLIESWKPLHYNIALTLNRQLSEITAIVEVTIQSLKDDLKTVDLDFGELTVDSVLAGGEKARFDHANGRLNIFLDKPLARNARTALTIAYHGVPKDGFILSTDRSGKPSAIGDNWPDRVHHWIPTFDHPSAKATVKFSVTALERTLVVANGAPGAVTKTADGKRIWTFSEPDPIPPYCMVIAVGEFALLRPGISTVTPLSYYVPQIDKDVAIQDSPPQMLHSNFSVRRLLLILMTSWP